MRFIEDLRDKYKNQEIWVVGPGPSLDDFPEDFFTGKVSIVMRPCDVVFPNFTFSICSYDQPEFCSQFKTNSARLKRQIFTLNPKHKANWLSEYNKYPIFFRTLKPYSFRDSPMWLGIGKYVTKVHVEETIKEIMKKKSQRYAGIGIMQGWTIETALVLGASKVTLAGCEGRIAKFRWHAERVSFHYASTEAQNLRPSANGFSEVQLKFFAKLEQRMQTEVQWFAEILKPYGIEISRYFYGTGYRKVI